MGYVGARALWAGLGMGKSDFSWENHWTIVFFQGKIMGKSDCLEEKSWEYLGTEERMDETAQLLYKHLINAMAYPNGIQLQILRKKW